MSWVIKFLRGEIRQLPEGFMSVAPCRLSVSFFCCRSELSWRCWQALGEGVFFLLYLGVAPGILEVRFLNGQAHRGDMAPCCACCGIRRWEGGCGVELGSQHEGLLPTGARGKERGVRL